MNDNILLDTNLWIYFYSTDIKSEKVQSLLEQNFDTVRVSTQVLTEIYNVLTKKKLQTIENAEQIIKQIASQFTVYQIDSDTVLKAIEINKNLRYSFYDSLLIATALQQNCRILYSEDLHHQHIIENRLQIINPFLMNG